MKYSLTNDTVTVFVKGEPYSVTKGAPNYDPLRRAVLDENWDAIPNLLTVEKAVETWVEAVSTPTTKVVVQDETVSYDGENLPKELNDRILKMVGLGESPTPILNFWRRLKRNPNQRSVAQLWGFLAHSGIPLQTDGTFLAYKGVRKDFRDAHSGQFDNSPGKTIKMDRSKISTDPSQTCHVGLHVGALNYAKTFSAQCIIVRVDPEHVCCVPNDYNAQKMRVCEYTVVGLYGAQLPSTTFEADAPVAVQASKTVEDAPEPEGKDLPVEEKQIPITGTPWDDFNPMPTDELLTQSLDDLRKYARYNCLITGASKLPGGKEALVAKIIAARTPAPVAAPVEVEETAPTPAGEAAAVKLPLTGTPWDSFNAMDTLELMKQSIDDLRKYASRNCLITGASKMPGGKIALVTRIADIRDDARVI